MEVKLSQAAKMFYSKSSFDMIYLEAVANALDADATEVKIDFEALSVSNTELFKLNITDNGKGFTDDRYDKFCKLMNVTDGDKMHKGLGRLVYLFYFDVVKVKSHFSKTKYREFTLDENLEGSSAD
ncbi:MAG: ATP-binding protein, partial [Rikenellaceae bacterium]